jgi:lipid-binding SYLF domain-containing protein
MRRKSWQRLGPVVLGTAILGAVPVAAQSPEFAATFARATTTLYEMVNVPDSNGIPRAVLSRAQGVAVFPGVVKGALLFGGTAGDGVVTVRRPDGSWGPPAILRLTGASLGPQIGAEVSDVVLVILSARGLEGLLASEATIGADISAAAGPTGRRLEAATDLRFTTDLVTYSRNRGLFAGLSIGGARIRAADDWNHALYGRGYTAREILLGTTLQVPEVARGFLQTVAASSGPSVSQQ